MRLLLRIVIGSMAVLSSVQANATVLTFDAAQSANSYLESGYIFQGAPGAAFKVHNDAGSTALEGPNPFAPPFNPQFNLYREDGAAFDFVSLDVYQADSNGLGVPITFTGLTTLGQQVVYTFLTPEYGNTATPDTRTAIVLPGTFSDLQSVSWSNGAEWHQFDNVTVNLAGAVPEPSTWAMMILGIGLAGASMRRRQRQTVRYDLA